MEVDRDGDRGGAESELPVLLNVCVTKDAQLRGPSLSMLCCRPFECAANSCPRGGGRRGGGEGGLRGVVLGC